LFKLEMGLIPKHAALISAVGDSMEPTIKEGDLLLVDLRENEVKNDAVYVIRIDDHLITKRIQRMYDSCIVIKSDNPAYNDQVIPKDAKDTPCIIGRVVWAGRRF
jgi:phage repressor protein C with HTH and peptisase S24 domain